MKDYIFPPYFFGKKWGEDSFQRREDKIERKRECEIWEESRKVKRGKKKGGRRIEIFWREVNEWKIISLEGLMKIFPINPYYKIFSLEERRRRRKFDTLSVLHASKIWEQKIRTKKEREFWENTRMKEKWGKNWSVYLLFLDSGTVFKESICESDRKGRKKRRD